MAVIRLTAHFEVFSKPIMMRMRMGAEGHGNILHTDNENYASI